jgi:hypothetical protein
MRSAAVESHPAHRTRKDGAPAASLHSYFKIPCGRRRWNPTLRKERARMGHPAAEYPYSSARIGLALDAVPQRLKPSEFDVSIAAVNRCATQRQGQYKATSKSQASCLRGIPPCAKNAQGWGTPTFPSKQRQNQGQDQSQRQRTGMSAPHGSSENTLTHHWECRTCRGPFGFAQGRLFDSVAASLREAATPLRMTSYLRHGSSQTPSEHHHRFLTARRRQWRLTCCVRLRCARPQGGPRKCETAR